MLRAAHLAPLQVEEAAARGRCGVDEGDAVGGLVVEADAEALSLVVCQVASDASVALM